LLYVNAERAPRRDAAENRAALLTAAAAVLARDPEAPLEAVAAAAGLSRRALYGHFSSRDDMWAELLRRGAERVQSAVTGVEHPDSRVEIALTGARLWEQVEDVRVLAQAAVRGPLQKMVGETLAPLRTALARSVTRGVAAGELRQDIEPARLARLIEGAALAVLDEATRFDVSDEEGRRLVMAATLAVAGLSWREARELVEATPELREGEER
jgi:AcrR family transcriptional regulator